MKKENNDFELIFERDDSINSKQMNALRGGSPDGCISITIIVIELTIGKEQPPPPEEV